MRPRDPSDGSQPQQPFCFRVERLKSGDAILKWAHPAALPSAPPAGFLHFTEMARVVVREPNTVAGEEALMQQQLCVQLCVAPARLQSVSDRVGASFLQPPHGALELVPLDANNEAAVRALRAFANELRVQHGRVQMAVMAGGLTPPPSHSDVLLQPPHVHPPPHPSVGALGGVGVGGVGGGGAEQHIVRRHVTLGGGQAMSRGAAPPQAVWPLSQPQLPFAVVETAAESHLATGGAVGTATGGVSAATAADTALHNAMALRRRVALAGGSLTQLLAQKRTTY